MYGGDRHDPQWGGANFGPTGIPSYLGFGQQQTTFDNKERIERQIRIEPFFEPIKNGAIVELFKEEMLELIKDFKKEGNDLYKDKDYVKAGDHYTCALLLGHMIQTNQNEEVDKELLSTLFSNRAACFLKMDMYSTGIEDCNIAIDLNKSNIKSYYRKATALKSLKKYEEASKAAHQGRGIANNLEKRNEIQDFDDLLREINSHLCRTTTPQNSAQTSHQMPGSNQKNNQAAANRKQSKKATISATRGTETQQKNPNVDESWLQGTNVHMSQKSAAGQDKKTKKSKKKQQSEMQSHLGYTGNMPSKAHYRGRYSTLQEGPSSSSSGEESADSTEEESESSDSGIISVSASGTNIALHSPVQRQSQKTEQYSQQYIKQNTNQNVAGARPKQNQTKPPVSGMGLDEDFHTVTHPVQPTQPKIFNTRNTNTYPPSAPVRPPVAVFSPEKPKTMQQTFPPITTQKLLPYPFNSKYEFTLACLLCFKEQTPGPQGYICLVNHPHQCRRDIFLCRNKGETNTIWYEVRSRPQVLFSGAYRLCQQFLYGKPCKVHRLQCTFSHNEIEQHLWTLDRSGQFDLNKFKVEWQAHVKATTKPMVKPPPPHVPQHGLHQQQQQKPPHPQMAQQHQQPRPPSFQPPIHHPPPVPQPQPAQSWYDKTCEFEEQQQMQHRHQQQQQHQHQQQQMSQPPQQQRFPPSSQHQQNAGFGGGISQGQLQPPNANHFPSHNQNIIPRHAQASNMIIPEAQAEVYFTNQNVNHPDGHVRVVQKYIFPLKDSHVFRILCMTCLHPTTMMGEWSVVAVPHKCLEDTLAVQPKGHHSWIRIRERKNHRVFKGSYIACHYFGSNLVCSRGDNCSFAHSREEQFLWTLEKDQRFNITEFLLQNRSPKTKQCFSMEDLFRKHPGWFQYICQSCFYTHPPRISIQNPANPTKCSAQVHIWTENMLLVHVKKNTPEITAIANRPFTHKGCFYLLCHKMQYCLRKKQQSGCSFAHSMVERDVWLLERDCEIARQDLVVSSHAYLMGEELPPPSKTIKSQGQGPVPVHHGPSKGAADTPTTQTHSGTAKAAEPEKLRCPYRITEICGLCWKVGQRKQRDNSRPDRCSGPGNGHIWSQNKAYVLLPESKIIRPLPRKIPGGYRFIICKHIRERKKCDYSLGGICQFAHSDQEIEVWTWMVKNNVVTLENLYQASHDAQTPTSSTVKPIPKGQTVVWANPMPAVPARSAFQLSVNALHCHYCSIQCNSQKQWDMHCASEKHLFNLNTDKEHQWNYRQPPWGVKGGSYETCTMHEVGKCPYSAKPDMYNFCKFAHGQEELDEWKERWEWRQMKRDIAKFEHMYSFMEELMEDYETADSGITVIAEEVAGVEVTCSADYNVFLQEKSSKYVWTINVKTTKDKPLQRVALLHNQDRLHFFLQTDDQVQISPGDSFLERSLDSRVQMYKIQVMFTGGMFGSFMQWVVFDFGSRPVLVRKLGVELGSRYKDKVKKLREHLTFDRWTGENRVIVKVDDRSAIDNFPQSLRKRYKPPSSVDTVITQQSVGISLNRHNYIHKMHQLLEMEEITMAQIISSFNLKGDIDLMQTIQEEGHFINAGPGELFARVPLNEDLTEDTDAGKLILTSVQTVLLALDNSTDNKVYETKVVTRDNFDYDGRGRDYIYICLSPVCVRELELVDGSFCSVELQFQMNRLAFCCMHFAIDRLENNDVVFPDVSKIEGTGNENRVFRLSSETLNEDQLRIVEHIMAERPGYAPPIVVFGPFGTGKTETLAQAAMLVVKQNWEARVLICSQSNSAADLYITKHFDAFCRKNSNINIVRVYFEERRVNTVNPTVKKYCLLSADGSKFVTPIREDILSVHIVITTLRTSLSMSRLRDLKGFFTHIFVDEAGQALECEAIMPLSLATENTCVVLSGDHLQMSPKVYSKEAKQQKFHKSLLERLYRHYDEYHRTDTDTSPLNILLSINYRTKMEILRFISAIFYGGPDKLHSASGIAGVDGVMPLNFYTTHGQEVQDIDSTTYYNMSEVEEIVTRVCELYENWPTEWGERKADTIGVMSPYGEQVNRIRIALRKKRLNGITVERVMNIQGKEFRAIFLTTVRTIHLGDSPPEFAQGVTESDGDIGDFGFLSDMKLLNTALTRAQSFVGVVGDPVALCLIGDCTTVWRAYLKHCQNLKSIQPQSVTLEKIKNQVINLTNSTKGKNIEMLNNLSQQIKEGKYQPPQKQQRKSTIAMATRRTEPSVTQPSVKTTPFDIEPSTADDMDEDWNLDNKVESDDIIKQLAKDAMKVCKLELEKNKEVVGTTPVSSKLEEEPLKLEYVRVKENEGHAVLLYAPTWASVTKKRQLFGANDHDKQFDYDEDLSEDDDSDSGMRSVYMDLSVQQLTGMLEASPDKLKHCILHIDNSSRMYAKVKDPKCELKEIKISSRLRCGRAFNNDEVVVELLEPDEEDVEVQVNEDKAIPQGQVVGILKRAINPHYRMFVCMVEEGNTGLMVPLNRGIPKIFNLETKNHLKKTRRGHVCVYTLGKDKEIKFDHYESIDPSDSMSKLFIVRYLKWDAKFYSPLGIVVGTIPAGTTMETGLKILNIEYFIPNKFKETTEREVAKMFSKFTIPPSEMGRRVDFRDRLTFTIDPPESQDLDDALSIEDLPNGQFRIGVHIADVSYFVKKGTAIDLEACSRGVTYYPVGGEPVPMLPKRLSTDLCSLQPHQDRLTLSVFMTINTSAQIVDTQIRSAVINNKYKLEYLDVEEILDGEDLEKDVNDKVKHSIQKLYKISHRWRRVRLGNQGLYANLDMEASDSPKAHLLVEEMMIMTNHQVALMLMQNFPQCTPLRVQMPPNELALDEWRQQYKETAKNSVALKQPFLRRGDVCLCTDQCTCIDQGDSLDNGTISIQSDVWHNAVSVLLGSDGETEELMSLISMPERSPETSVALLKLRSLQEKGNYINTGDTPEDLQHHYSLNMHGYTHFTSPIRRYVDIVVHRLLNSLVSIQSSPYTEEEVTSLCAHCTDALQKARRYEQATERLQLAAMLQNTAAVMFPVIEAVDEMQLQLRFPTVSSIIPSRSNVKMPLLRLSDKPQEVDNAVNVKWQLRIYDTKPNPNVETSGMNQEANLNPYRFIVKIPSQDWRKLVFSVIKSDTELIFSSVIQVNKNIENPSNNEDFAKDVSSEVKNISHSKHFCEFSLALKTATLMKVQVTTELFKGIITPKLQLLELTPTLDVCLEHRGNPALCFANNTTLHASKPQYRDLESYSGSWLRVLALESAHTSAAGGDSLLIHHVGITWKKIQQASGDLIVGTFVLPLQFCLARQINFSGSTAVEEEEDEDEIQTRSQTQFLDYFCVRYSQLLSNEPDENQHSERFDIDFEHPASWVGHCLSTEKVVMKEAGLVQMTLQLHQSSVQIPGQLMEDGASHTATVEFIPKALPNRRQEAAIRNIHKANGLAKDVALGRKIDNMSEEHQTAMKDFKQASVPNLIAPNQKQQHAVSSALTQAFTLIQGPPGTGKTVTGVRIAYLFAMYNRTRPASSTRGATKPQVLYCGPSNKSVDVVAAYLKKVGAACPKMVRVYSESIELQEFPLPMDPVSGKYRRQKKYIRDSNIEDLALHHLIRNSEECSVASLIREFDERIQICRNTHEAFTGAELEQYRNLIAHAEVEVLKKKEIILCTCNASCSPKLRFGSNIMQLIIDECGMCTEPESMVPIVTSRPEQIVLIGDHKQLRPVVLDDRAKNLGLETSLFERYYSKAIMLTTQYRMHEAISEFPSQHFYDNKLDNGMDEQSKPSQLKFWPNGRNKPVTFVHVMGREEALTVATDEGSEQSRSNMDEVNQAVRAATLLVRRFHVNPREVVVLSQYRAQCAKIEEILLQKGEKDIMVNTVVAAQGSEWDYVILSTVRSLPKSEIEKHPTMGWCRRNLGFITDEHQINVAITRARKGLIIIGNKYLLSCNHMWNKLLMHYQSQRKVLRVNEFMS